MLKNLLIAGVVSALVPLALAAPEAALDQLGLGESENGSTVRIVPQRVLK